MKYILFVTILSALLVWISGQAPPHNGTIPPKCCIPDKQMEMTYASNIATGTSYFRQRVRGAFDFTGRRYGSVSDVEYINGTQIRVRFIILAAENIQYYIFNGTCTRLQDVFVEPRLCIPDDYDYTDSFTIGNGELYGHSWGGTINDSKHGIYGTNDLAFTAQTCVPIGQTSLVYIGVPPNLAAVSDSGVYTNYTKGIADPGFWFIPPSFCSPSSTRSRRYVGIPDQHLLLSRIAMLGSWSTY